VPYPAASFLVRSRSGADFQFGLTRSSISIRRLLHQYETHHHSPSFGCHWRSARRVRKQSGAEAHGRGSASCLSESGAYPSGRAREVGGTTSLFWPAPLSAREIALTPPLCWVNLVMRPLFLGSAECKAWATVSSRKDRAFAKASASVHSLPAPIRRPVSRVKAEGVASGKLALRARA
jgi:hypothetical protein